MYLLVTVSLSMGVGVLRAPPGEGASATNEVRASKFVVVDEGGRKLGEFGVMEDGTAAMVIENTKTHTGISVGTDRSGMPRITLTNSKAAALLELAMLEDKYPAFIMSDGDGRRRLGMVVTDTGSVTLSLYDTKKQNRCAIALAEDGHPTIALRDERGEVRARLTLDGNGMCALDLLDEKGRARVVFQVEAQGEADAAVFGKDNKAIWSSEKP